MRKAFTPAQKGLITGALMILASAFFLYVLKSPVEGYFQIAVYLLFCAGIAWSLVAYARTAVQDKQKFKDYFSTGFKTFVVVALLMTAATYLYFSFHPEFRESRIAENNRLLLAQGNHLPAEIEGNSQQLRKLFMPLMISSAIFRYLIIGAIFTAVTAGFLSRKTAVHG